MKTNKAAEYGYLILDQYQNLHVRIQALGRSDDGFALYEIPKSAVANDGIRVTMNDVFIHQYQNVAVDKDGIAFVFDPAEVHRKFRLGPCEIRMDA